MFRLPATLRKFPCSRAGAGSSVHAFEFASTFSSYQGTPSIALLLTSTAAPTPSLRVACYNRVRCGAPEFFSTFALSDDWSSEAIPEWRMKKKVAMWLGYVGTRYKGLQIQRRPGSAQSKCHRGGA